MFDFSVVDETCHFCETDIEVPIDKVSKCPNCGREIVPCAGCDVPADCDWNNETYCCHRFAHSTKEIEFFKTIQRKD